MRKITILLLAILLVGCCECEEQPKEYPKLRTFEITLENRRDTIIATRAEYAHWTVGGKGVKVFDGSQVIGFYRAKDGIIVRELNTQQP